MKFSRLAIFCICLHFFGQLSAQPACHPQKSQDLAEHIGHGDLSNLLVDSVKWVIEKEPGRWISCYKTKKSVTRKFYKKIEGKTLQTDFFLHDCLVLVFVDESEEISKVKLAIDPKSGRIYSIEFSCQ